MTFGRSERKTSNAAQVVARSASVQQIRTSISAPSWISRLSARRSPWPPIDRSHGGRVGSDSALGPPLTCPRCSKPRELRTTVVGAHRGKGSARRCHHAFHREKVKAPVASKSGALRWGQDRERHLLQHGPEPAKKEVPTLEEFVLRFLEGYAKAERHKPSGVASKETICRIHLIPQLGNQKLDAITNAEVQRLKLHLADKAPKTVNNVLALLDVMLKTAVEWELIDRLRAEGRERKLKS